MKPAASSWIFIVPVSGLCLSGEISREFSIDRVTFVDAQKLPRIRQRLGFPKRIADYGHSSSVMADFLAHDGTWAVLNQSGSSASIRPKCLKMVADELAILGASQLGWSKRRSRSLQRVARVGDKAGAIRTVFVDRKSAADSAESFQAPVHELSDLLCDKPWRAFQSRHSFFGPFLRLLQQKSGATSWRDTVRRVLILAGKSQSTDDLAQAFLLNVIALETILTAEGDSIQDTLPAPAEALLGWVGFWEMDQYAERIRELYQKRCRLVHDGRLDDITVEDLLFSDDLLFNLLLNLARHPAIFCDKNSIRAFAEKVQAERSLGIRPRLRPTTLSLFSQQYSPQDLLEI
jgi:hypothetical protein